MTHSYTLKTQVGKFEVQVSPTTSYGYFEHEDFGDECGGGLWFVDKELSDYDGVFSLPKEVREAIAQLGYSTAEMFRKEDAADAKV